MRPFKNPLQLGNEHLWEGMPHIVMKCYTTACDKGWWVDYVTDKNHRVILTPDELAAKLCLIHSEVSEALEDVRTGDVEPGTVDDAGKSVGLPSELADIIIRVFDLCGALGIDITDALRQKMAYNDQREYRHGGKAL